MPRVQNFDYEMCGSAETEKPDSFSLFYAGNAEAAKSDNPGAQ
jgi:hypothetical protein